MHNKWEIVKKSLGELEQIKERLEKVIVYLDVENHHEENDICIDADISEKAEILERAVASLTETIDLIEDIY